MQLSFVIPCYGSENTISDVVTEIKSTIGDKYSYEIILVNDNSPDGVWSVIAKLASEDEKVKGLSLARNFGQHAALMAGYSYCSGEYVISLDDDGQTPVDAVPDLIAKLEEGYDVVYGSYPKIKQSLFRIFGSKVNELMTEVLIGKPKGLKATSYYIARRFIIEEMLRYKNAYPYVGGLVFRATKNIANVPVQHRERAQGASGYSLRKLLSLWFNGFTAFSEKPLRLATFVGVIVAMIGFIYGIVIVVRKIMIPATQLGYSSMMATMLFLGGIIMLLLGVIGEYIGRIYISLNSAPQFVIRDKVGVKTDEEQ